MDEGRGRTDAVEWTNEDMARLRELWDEGVSATECGRLLGRSKNSIIGKAHRLGFTLRPSPIKRDGAPRPPRICRPRYPRVTLAPITRPAVIAPTAPVVIAKPSPPPPLPRQTKCCWPLGEVKSSGFRFCDEPAKPGKSYCTDHCKLAYVGKADLPRYGAQA